MEADQPVGAEVVAEVRRVFHGGLLGGKSAFAPETDAWTEATASDLRARFVDRPDESSDTFLVKLRRQLDGAPLTTVVLAAELLFVNMAPLKPEQIGLRKKLQILGEILSWAGLAHLAKPGAARPEGLDLIWRTQILPLLEDQVYGTGVDVEEEYGLASLRAALGS